MTIGLLLLLLAILLAILALVVPGHSLRLLAGAVISLAFAVWLGVPALALA